MKLEFCGSSVSHHTCIGNDDRSFWISQQISFTASICSWMHMNYHY